MVIGVIGPRPHKIPNYSTGGWERLFCHALKVFTELRPTHVVSGMAQGVDMIYAEAALLWGAKLICALPFHGHYVLWEREQIERYKSVVDRASKIVYVDEARGYSAGAYQKRNEWIVSNVQHLIAYDNEYPTSVTTAAAYAIAAGKLILSAYNLKDILN